MKLTVNALGLGIKPESVNEAFDLGITCSELQGRSGLYLDREQCSLFVNLKELEKVDQALRWEGTGQGRIERIQELLTIEENQEEHVC